MFVAFSGSVLIRTEYFPPQNGDDEDYMMTPTVLGLVMVLNDQQKLNMTTAHRKVYG